MPQVDDTQRIIGQLQAEIRQLREALEKAEGREAKLADDIAQLHHLLAQVMGAVRMLRWLGAAIVGVVGMAGAAAGRFL
jgi:septal ring factor EnvC (AmiA/AmiB activator)